MHSTLLNLAAYRLLLLLLSIYTVDLVVIVTTMVGVSHAEIS